MRALAAPLGLPLGEARRGLPCRKKGCVPLCAPMVHRGKVEREKGVTAASLATAFSHRAKWCPPHLLATLPCYCVVRFLPSAPLSPGLRQPCAGGRRGGGSTATGAAIRFSITALLPPSLQPGTRLGNRACYRQIRRTCLLRTASAIYLWWGCVPPPRDLLWRLWP